MTWKSERDHRFTAFVLAQRAALVRVAALLLSGDLAKAEDAVQTGLVRLYLAWPRVRPETLEAYARRCVVNAAIDDHRSLFRRREQVQAQVPDVACAEAASGDGSGIATLLAILPPRMRAVIVLRYIEGFSVAETAEALGCGEGTVKSQSARGLDHLRAVYPTYARTFV